MNDNSAAEKMQNASNKIRQLLIRSLKAVRGIRLIDGVVVFTFFCILFFDSSNEFLQSEIIYIIGLGYFSCYFFEKGRKKTFSWLVTSFLWMFYLNETASPGIFPYAVFTSIILAIMIWLYSQINLRILLKAPVIGAIAATGFVGMVLGLNVLSPDYEIKVFFYLSTIIVFIPFAVALGLPKRSGATQVFQACSIQQLFLRSAFVYWCFLHQDQIASFDFFNGLDMPLIAAMYFLPFFAILNQRRVQWHFLYETFLSLLIIYTTLSGEAKSLVVATIMISLGGMNSIFHMSRPSEIWKSKILCSLERGGFGGIYFFMSIALLFTSHHKETFLQLTLLFILVFIFSAAAVYVNKQEDGIKTALSRREVNGRLIYQLIGFGIFLWVSAL